MRGSGGHAAGSFGREAGQVRIVDEGDGHRRPDRRCRARRARPGRRTRSSISRSSVVRADRPSDGGQHRVRRPDRGRAIAARATAIAGQHGRDRQALRAGQARRAPAVQRRQPDGRQRAGVIGPQVPGLLDAAVHAGRRAVGGVLQVDGHARQVRIGRAELIAQAGERLIERVGVHRAAEAVARARPGAARVRRVRTPDVDRQVVAHLVDQQEAAIGADLIGPARRPAPSRGGRRRPCHRAGSRPAPRAWSSCRPAAPRWPASRPAGVRGPPRASPSGARRGCRGSTISTALIGWGGDQW